MVVRGERGRGLRKADEGEGFIVGIEEELLVVAGLWVLPGGGGLCNTVATDASRWGSLHDMLARSQTKHKGLPFTVSTCQPATLLFRTVVCISRRL